jgi:hypothetical protein
MPRRRLDPERAQTATERSARRRERAAEREALLRYALEQVAVSCTLEEARAKAAAALQLWPWQADEALR